MNRLTRCTEVLDFEGQPTRATHCDELVLQLDQVFESFIAFHDSIIRAANQLLSHRSTSIFHIGMGQHNDLRYLECRNDCQMLRCRGNKRIQYLSKLISFQEKSIRLPAALACPYVGYTQSDAIKRVRSYLYDISHGQCAGLQLFVKAFLNFVVTTRSVGRSFVLMLPPCDTKRADDRCDRTHCLHPRCPV